MTFEEKIKDIILNYNLGNFLKAESLAKSLLTKTRRLSIMQYLWINSIKTS